MPEVQPSWSLFQVLQEAPREETQGGVGQVQHGVGLEQHRRDRQQLSLPVQGDWVQAGHSEAVENEEHNKLPNKFVQNRRLK